MADPDGLANRPEDPFVRSRTGSGGGPVVSLAGLLGDSDRPGCRRLYLTTTLDYFVEFRAEHVIGVADVPPEQAPFMGLDATRVDLVADATLDWVHRGVGAADPFVLLASDRKVQPRIPDTWQAACPAVTHHFGESDFDPCPGGVPGTGGGTFGPLPTQGGRTCVTCNQGTCATCDQGTCVTCGRGTCATCGRGTCATCGQDTCATCGRNTCATCGQGTCATCGRVTCDRCVPTLDTCASCAGTCNDNTCATCWNTCAETCATCWDTCVGTCVSCRGTCDATCAKTCADTCANTCWGTCAATCDTCFTCFFTCGTCDTDPGWCIQRG